MCGVRCEAREGTRPELMVQLLDVSVDGERSDFAELMAAEATRFDSEAADACSPCCVDVPNAVTEGQGALRVDRTALHCLDEHFRGRLRLRNVVRRCLIAELLIDVEQSEDHRELVGWSRCREHNRYSSPMDPANQLARAGEDARVVDQFFVTSRPRRCCPRTVMAKQLGHKPIPAHAHQTMNGIHGSPFSSFTERPGPGQRVEVVGIDERPVDVEEHTGPEPCSHAGRSLSHFAEVRASPVRLPSRRWDSISAHLMASGFGLRPLRAADALTRPDAAFLVAVVVVTVSLSQCCANPSGVSSR